MTLAACLFAVLAAATVVAWSLRAARDMDDREAQYRRRVDEVEQARRDRFRRAMERDS